MTKPLLVSLAAVAMLALGACVAEDSQTTQNDIDQDITVSHQPGSATLDNLGQGGFAPWRFTTPRP
jgi:outer membrane biogenesis lipoprotein LolB